ncbi:MAG TPA: O-antigen ligase family protein [Solirubrobacteraceae bacterium]|jgi:hypothetical protein|nr:O-antigen ligase family protein [Solirubrobacteraceae bacterium]
MTAADHANVGQATAQLVGPAADSAQPAPRLGLSERLAPHLRAGLPGLIVVGLMLVWAAHDGGYDADTWYWGALVVVGMLGVSAVLATPAAQRYSRLVWIAVGTFALYVLWSYASLAWAQDPGLALEGSNRALLYLGVFALMAGLPWTAQGALAAMLCFAVGVGTIAVVLLFRLASADHVSSLLAAGRMNSPTGYYNATAALFTMDALVCVVLATLRRLPGPLRGLLVAFAGAALQLAIAGQSRGWLFTLPLVLVLALVVVPERLRVMAAALIPAAAAALAARQMLHIYDVVYTARLNDVAAHAGHVALLVFGAAFMLGTLLAWADRLSRRPPLRTRTRRAIGAVACVLAVAAGCAGALVVSHGRPFHFISTQWQGFSHPQTKSTGSHFGDVGSARYDFWRVSLDAFVAHPVGGLGQDNFGDYYTQHRRSYEEPSWTHSIELRLLTHTGIVGFVVFVTFLVTALVAAARTRRRAPPLARLAAGIGLLPLIVWLVQGSLDWFWELPALSGPALGFLGIAVALGRPQPQPRTVTAAPRRAAIRWAGIAATAALFAAAIVVLAFPYLSVREVSIADDEQAANPAAALRDFSRAADLNPLSSIPGRLAGAVALTSGENTVAAQRFRQSIDREPGGWFAWLGAGLAASANGDRAAARHDYQVAFSINSRQPAIRQAIARVNSRYPLTSDQAFKLLVVD